MSLETVIPYIVQHNALIIQVLVSAILLLVVILAYRNFSAARQSDPTLSSSGGSADLGQLEATLKKLLEKANQVPSAAAAAPGDNPALLTEIEKLKRSLEDKQTQMEKLKAEAEAAKAGGGAGAGVPAAAGISSEERGQLETQIKDLQAKLSEYEIISEDIADLSFYKEENVKLQKEIETIKKGGAAPAPAAAAPATPPPAPAAAPVPASAPAPEAPKAAPTMAGSAKATAAAAAEPPPAEPPAVAVAPEPTPEPVAPPAPAPVAEAPRPAAKAANPHASVDEDLMAEFAAAVEQQKKPGAPVAAATQAPDPAPAPAKAAAPAPAAAPVPEKATVVSGNFAPTPDENPLGSGLDVDKIAGEVTELVAAGNTDVGNSLEGELNPDKLLEEAATMESIKPEDAKLMNEFEDFVKKGGVG